MIDGWLARKLQAESKIGSILDSIADLSFVACCAIQLLPALSIPSWLWIWAGIIAIIKIVNQISSLIIIKRFCFPHTITNKLTGVLLFITVPTIDWSIIPIAIAAIIATFAAIQEGYYPTLSFLFHHTQMDGAHAGKFLANLQNEIHKLA